MKSRLVLVVAGCLVLAACSVSMPKVWPFYKKPKPGPEAVNEVELVQADGAPANFPQYWKRNTLVIDLSSASGQGSLAARLPPETTWPVRMAVRVRPGSVGQLEVQAEERNILPVTGVGDKPVDIALAPSVYRPETSAIYIAWGPQMPAVDTGPAEEAPSFVSPTQLPKPVGDDTPSASEIVPPGEVAPAQPPPGD